MAPHVHDRLYWVIIPINTAVVDGKQWDSLAVTIANRLWHLGCESPGANLPPTPVTPAAR